MKINTLTFEQQKKIIEYRDRYFQQAVSTEPADRQRAEKAALQLAEIEGVKVSGIEWENSPENWDSLSDSLRDSLGDSFSDSLWNSLSDLLWNSLSDLLWESLSDSLSDSLCVSASLSDSLCVQLSVSLWDFLWDLLRASLSGSLSDSASLSDSSWDSLWDSGGTAYYSYVVDELGIEIGDEERELLKLYNEIAASCFAIWIVPGTVILCERPASVDIKKGKLVGITWRNSECAFKEE